MCVQRCRHRGSVGGARLPCPDAVQLVFEMRWAATDVWQALLGPGGWGKLRAAVEINQPHSLLVLS